jgi:hypothetical protein
MALHGHGQERLPTMQIRTFDTLVLEQEQVVLSFRL